MATARPDPDPPAAAAAPRGSWPRTYALVALSAVLVMLALLWFTRSYNIPLPAAR